MTRAGSLLAPACGETITIATNSFGYSSKESQQHTMSNSAWPVADRAIYQPIRICTPILVVEMLSHVEAQGAGNLELGIYTNDNGPDRKLVSASRAGGANSAQTVNITDTLVGPGLYWIAMAADATTINCRDFSGGQYTAEELRIFGILQEASAFNLPATATAVKNTGTILPLVVLSAYSLGIY